MLEDLKAQLARCESWLLEEPEDQEVIEKVKELKSKIESIENSADEKVVNKDENLIREMKSLKRKLRNLKKKLVNQPENPFILEEISEIESKIEKLKIERQVR